MDLDTSYYLLPKNSYVHALNITRDSVVSNKDRVVSNLLGNRVLLYAAMPAGTNKCIGAYANPLRNTVISFVYNSNNHHSVLETNLTTRAVTRIFESLLDTDTDILNFTTNGKITGVNIYSRDEGDLLFFLDSIGRPTTMNITRFKAQQYNPVTRDIIDVGKRPPLAPPDSVFGNDTSRSANNFFKKLTRYKYRWVYDDNEKSTYSPIGAIPLPINILDPVYTNVVTNNNLVNLSLNSGPQNVKAIELCVSISENSNQWDAFQLVETINKSDESISDDVDFPVSFYNDSTYPFIDPNESILLFDYVPDYAIAQETPNGNVLCYGNITEGYDRTLSPNVVVTINTIAAGNGGSVGSLNGVLQLGTGQTISAPEILFSGIPATGTVITIRLKRISDNAIITAGTYTTIAGDTVGTSTTGVIGGLITSMLSLGIVLSATSSGANRLNFSFRADLNAGSPKYFYNYTDLIITAPTTAADDNSIATWKWSTERNLGIVYFDQKGKTNGVIYNTHITFPPYNENGSHVCLIPYINIKIYHVPPEWAYSYQIVFTKEPTQYLFIETVDVNTTETDFLYFDITNLALNQTKNPTTAQVVSWTFQEGDKMRLIRRMADGHVFGSTFETFIEGIVTDPRINNVVQTGKTFVKIKNVAPFAGSPYGTDFFVIELFRPGVQPPSVENNAFFECGVQFAILNPTTSTRVHAGEITDQSTDYSIPAEFNIYNGDSYFRSRTEVLSETGFGTFNVQDRNFVDFYISSVSSVDGRAEAIEINARTATYGAFIRHGEAYQPNTNINGLNRFYPNNFLDCDYSFGSIMRLLVRDRLMKVFQRDKTGRVFFFNQISKDQAGNVVEVVTDKLLNPIQYYAGNWGIGTASTSLASFNFADYFCDNIRGVICRSSNDGVDPISVIYKMNSWATDELPLRTGTNNIYGAYDQKLNNYVIALEGNLSILTQFSFIAFGVKRFFYALSGLPVAGDIVSIVLTDGVGNTANYSYTAINGDTVTTMANGLAAKINAGTLFTAVPYTLFDPSVGLSIAQTSGVNPTVIFGSVSLSISDTRTIGLSFSEEDNTFESFLSLKPEMMCTVGNLFIAWLDGQAWTHDNKTYNNFFGVKYESSITTVFNENPLTDKSFQCLAQRSSNVWDCPEIITQSMSYGDTPQQSNLVEAEFSRREGKLVSSLKRDANSYGGKINGNFLKGSWIKIKFRRQSASELTTLDLIECVSIESPLNNR